MLSFAHDFEAGGIYYNITSSSAPYMVEVTYKGTYSTQYSNEYSGAVSIPSSVIYNGITYKVTGIGSSAFYCCTGLMSIEIPNSVTSIGTDAFYGTAWYNNQPDGLVYVGKVAYEYKGNMPNNTTIVLEEGTLGIAGDAFYKCSGLISITMPSSLICIGRSAFYGCSSLKSITIPNSVTSIGDDAFSKCTGLISIIIPSSVTTIGDYAFEGCTSLTSIEIPNSVTSIGEYAFAGCSGLTSIEIPNSVASIGYYAFQNCTGLTSITIPNSVTSIGQGSFDGCIGLTSVTIPNSVSSVGFFAFVGCTGLTSVTIGNSVTSIAFYAFSNCTGLTELVSLASIPPICNAGVFENVDKSLCTLKVPKGSKDDYRQADGWKDFVNIEEIDVTAIETVAAESMGKAGITDIYDLNGRRRDALQPGVNIVKMSDGTTRKVIKR